MSDYGEGHYQEYHDDEGPPAPAPNLEEKARALARNIARIVCTEGEPYVGSERESLVAETAAAAILDALVEVREERDRDVTELTDELTERRQVMSQIVRELGLGCTGCPHDELAAAVQERVAQARREQAATDAGICDEYDAEIARIRPGFVDTGRMAASGTCRNLAAEIRRRAGLEGK